MGKSQDQEICFIRYETLQKIRECITMELPFFKSVKWLLPSMQRMGSIPIQMLRLLVSIAVKLLPFPTLLRPFILMVNTQDSSAREEYHIKLKTIYFLKLI